MMAQKLQCFKTEYKGGFRMCILYIVAGSLLFISPGCVATGEVIVPHRVIYTPHVPRYKPYIFIKRSPWYIKYVNRPRAYRKYSIDRHKPYYRRHHKTYKKYNTKKNYKKYNKNYKKYNKNYKKHNKSYKKYNKRGSKRR